MKVNEIIQYCLFNLFLPTIFLFQFNHPILIHYLSTTANTNKIPKFHQPHQTPHTF